LRNGQTPLGTVSQMALEQSDSAIGKSNLHKLDSTFVDYRT
jgi:hypothetical protein